MPSSTGHFFLGVLFIAGIIDSLLAVCAINGWLRESAPFTEDGHLREP